MPCARAASSATPTARWIAPQRRRARWPRDATLRVRLADAQAAAGAEEAARASLAAALRQRPDLADVRRAARAVGLPLPLDGLRLDAKQVISDFRASGQRYAAPAVM